jgi:competence protein ComEC
MGKGLEWMIAIATLVSSWGGQVTTGRIPEAAFLFIAAGGVLACLLRTWLAISGLCVIAIGGFVAFAGDVPRPAVVIAEDGRLVAMIVGNAAASNRAQPPDFIFSQWQRALRLDDHHKPKQHPDLALKDAETPEKEQPSAGGAKTGRPAIDKDAARAAIRQLQAAATSGRFACMPKQVCVATTGQGWRIIVVDDARFIGIGCDEADIVITSVMLRFSICRSGATLLTGQSLRRSGAVEIHAGPQTSKGKAGIRLISAQKQLHRPWARHRTYDWRTGEFDDTKTGN